MFSPPRSRRMRKVLALRSQAVSIRRPTAGLDPCARKPTRAKLEPRFTGLGNVTFRFRALPVSEVTPSWTLMSAGFVYSTTCHQITCAGVGRRCPETQGAGVEQASRERIVVAPGLIRAPGGLGPQHECLCLRSDRRRQADVEGGVRLIEHATLHDDPGAVLDYVPLDVDGARLVRDADELHAGRRCDAPAQHRADRPVARMPGVEHQERLRRIHRRDGDGHGAVTPARSGAAVDVRDLGRAHRPQPPHPQHRQQKRGRSPFSPQIWAKPLLIQQLACRMTEKKGTVPFSATAPAVVGYVSA